MLPCLKFKLRRATEFLLALQVLAHFGVDQDQGLDGAAIAKVDPGQLRALLH